jgi:hypothetical protein
VSLIQTLTNEVAILNANVQEEREAREEDRRERDDLKNQLSNLYTDLVELQDKVDSRDYGTISSPTRSPPPKKKKTDDETPSITAVSQATIVLKVLFAKKIQSQTGPVQYELATLTDGAKTLLPLQQAQFAATWKRLHSASKRGFESNAHVLATLASKKFFVSPTLLRKILSGDMYDVPLSHLDSMDEWKRSWCLAHFASPSDTSEYHSYVATQQQEIDSDQLNQNPIHAVKKDPNLFVNQGHFDNTVDNILGSVANFLVVAQTLVVVPVWGNDPSNPALINYLHTLAGLLTREKSALMDIAKNCKHLLFQVFGYFQDVLGEFGRILTSSNIVDSLINIDFERSYRICGDVFTASHNAYEASLEELGKLVKYRTPPSSALGSYEVAHPRPTQPDEPTGNRPKKGKGQGQGLLQNQGQGHTPGQGQGSTPQMGDWLEMAVDARPRDFLPFPSGLRFCIYHAIKGKNCNLKNCPHPHVAHAALPAEQKTLLANHLSTKQGKFKVIQ